MNTLTIVALYALIALIILGCIGLLILAVYLLVDGIQTANTLRIVIGAVLLVLLLAGGGSKARS